MAEPEPLESRLAGLSKEARARVEQTMKEAIERELATEAMGPAAAREKEFSKGWFFSRSRPTTAMDLEKTVLQHAAVMDDKAFEVFASRLRSLKGMMKEERGGGR
jgi:hypothetical protein